MDIVSNMENSMDFEKIASRVVASIGLRVPDFTPRKRVERAQKAIAALEGALAAKHIWNVDIKDWKSILSRTYDDSRDLLHKMLMEEIGWWKMTPDERSDFYREGRWHAFNEIPFQMNQLKKFIRGVKTSKDPMAKEALQWAIEWDKIWELIVSLKPFIEKGRKPNPDAKPKDVYVAPRTSTKGLQMIRTALNKVVAHEADTLVEQVSERYIMSAKRFLDEREPADVVYSFYRRDPDVRPVVKKMVVETSEKSYDRSAPKTFEMSRDAKSVAIAAAKEVVKGIVERYLHKNQNKIGSIAERKGGLEKIKVSYGRLQGWGFAGEMVCLFSDGTQFTVRNKVVYKYSYRGTDYVQFPTTFHQVLWPDGKRSAMVPEKQMNEEWAKK